MHYTKDVLDNPCIKDALCAKDIIEKHEVVSSNTQSRNKTQKVWLRERRLLKTGSCCLKKDVTEKQDIIVSHMLHHKRCTCLRDAVEKKEVWHERSF